MVCQLLLRVSLDSASRETSSAQRTSYGFLQDASDSPVTLLGVAGVAKWLNVADVIGPGFSPSVAGVIG